MVRFCCMTFALVMLGVKQSIQVRKKRQWCLFSFDNLIGSLYYEVELPVTDQSQWPLVILCVCTLSSGVCSLCTPAESQAEIQPLLSVFMGAGKLVVWWNLNVTHLNYSIPSHFFFFPARAYLCQPNTRYQSDTNAIPFINVLSRHKYWLFSFFSLSLSITISNTCPAALCEMDYHEQLRG